MSAMMNLAKLRAAMVVGDFDFRNNGAPLTALPAILTALNATYTRNSVKNVVQSGALVALTANQFGTSYDDVTGLYGYVPEPAATNLATNSDGAVATYTLSTNVADGTAVSGFTNGIAFGDNSLARSAFKTVSMTSGTTYSVSVFVQMDDGGAPVVGAGTTTGDFCLVSEVTNHTSTAIVRYVGNGVYRVSSSRACVSSAAWYCGAKKYTGQSARTFRITGIQVETGLRATSYIATAGSTASRSADVLTVPLWVNNVKDSQDFSTANWSRTNCTVTTSGTAPDGSATAQLITVTTTASAQVNSALFKAPASTVTVSQYVKQGNKPTASLVLRNATTSTNFTVGTLTFATGVVTGTGWAATDVGNGWFRCTYTNQPGDVISVGDSLAVYPLSSASRTAGDTQYAWGFQLEPGSVATAYRRTVANLEFSKNRAGYSENCTGPNWTLLNVSGGATQNGNAFTFGASSSDRFNCSGIALGTGSFTYSAKLSGSGSIRLMAYDGDTSYKNALVITLTSTPTWYTLTVTLTAGGNAGVLGINNNGAGTAGASFTVHGVQVENGSSLTDYEPTNTIAPSANANIAGFSSAAYSLFADARSDVVFSGVNTFITVSDNTSNNRAMLYQNTSSALASLVQNGGASQASLTYTGRSVSRVKVAASDAANAFYAAVGGLYPAGDTSGLMAASPLFAYIGGDQIGASQFNGFIYRAQLIPTALTQAQLNGLTT